MNNINYINQFNAKANELKTATIHAKNKKSLADAVAWLAVQVYVLGTYEEKTELKAMVSKEGQYNFAKSYVSRAKKAVIFFAQNKDASITTSNGTVVNAALFEENVLKPVIALHSIAKAIDAISQPDTELTDAELTELGAKSLKVTKEDLILLGQSVVDSCLDEGKRIVAERQAKAQAKAIVNNADAVIKAFNALSKDEQFKVVNHVNDMINQDTMLAA